jgi:hypothetical protein
MLTIKETAGILVPNILTLALVHCTSIMGSVFTWAGFFFMLVPVLHCVDAF